MREELVPEDYDKPPAGSAVLLDGLANQKDGRKRRVKCPEMKYNKFQMYDLNDVGVTNHNPTHRDGGVSPDKSPVHLHQNTESDIREIRRYLRQLMQRIHKKEEWNRVALEWRIVALVMDRVFFFMYLFCIVISLATIFPKTYFRWPQRPHIAPHVSLRTINIVRITVCLILFESLIVTPN